MPSVLFFARSHTFLRCYDASLPPYAPSLGAVRVLFHHHPPLAHGPSSSATLQIHTRSPAEPFTSDPNIDITSLRNTLDAHREANRASVIRKTDGAGHSSRLAGHWTPFRKVNEEPTRHTGHVARGAKDGGQAYKTIESSSPYVAMNRRPRSCGLTSLWLPPEQGYTVPAQYRLPWLAYIGETQSQAWLSPVDRLSAEIRAFERYVSPTKEEQRAADMALKDLIKSIKRADDNLDVHVIGSRATDTADPLSDLDVNVSDAPTPMSTDSTKAPSDILDLLEKVFRGQHRSIKIDHGAIEVIYNLRKSKVPILLCRHKRTGLPIQIQSTPRAYDSTEYVRAFLKEFPTLRGLFKVLKQSFLMRGLSVGSGGGITSYPLLNMIVAALKFSEAKIDPNDAGNQLLSFLDMYTDIDFSSRGISIRPPQYFAKYSRPGRNGHSTDVDDPMSAGEMFKKELDAQRHLITAAPSNNAWRMGLAWRMTLQDPADPSNDLGGGISRIRDIQETLIAIQGKLRQAMRDWEKKQPASGSSRKQSLPRSVLEPFVGADYRIYEHERSDLKLVGRKGLPFVNLSEGPRNDP